MTSSSSSSVSLVTLLALSLAPVVVSGEGNDGGDYYRETVYPLLKENCFRCHGGESELKGDFRLTSRDGLLHGGHYGPAYNAEDPAASVLLEMISYKDADHQMPPRGKLSDEARAILQRYEPVEIREGSDA